MERTERAMVAFGGSKAAVSASGWQTEPACFLRGTRILTERGDVAVEDLALGDMVHTLSGGRRPVTWLGQRQVELARHPDPMSAWPVRLRRGALANGMPARDLLISPDHALFLNGVLIPGRVLLNGATVLPDPSWQRLDYFHVALDAHDILLAEGAPAESFPDRGSRATFAGGPVQVLHPQFPDTAQAASDYAARAVRGPAVQDARRCLLARARVLGHALTREPDLHLLADGTRVNSSFVSGQLYRFALPSGTRDIRIVCRAGVPAETDPMSEDRRRLGVMLSRIVLRCHGEPITLNADDPTLREGYHPLERTAGDAWRWTDGHAKLPPQPTGLTRLDLYVLGAQPAWARAVPPSAPAQRGG
jgi:Hint domain